MEADALRARKAGRERPEPGEGELGLGLREEADRGGGLRLGNARSEARGGRELPFRGDRPAEALQCRAVEQLRLDVAAAGCPLERSELTCGREARHLGRNAEARHERRLTRSEPRVKQALRLHRGLAVRIAPEHLAPGGLGGLPVPGGDLRQP